MQHEVPSFESLAPEYQQWIRDFELRFEREGHTWPVDEYGPCPPVPDWWTEEDEQSCHRQKEIFSYVGGKMIVKPGVSLKVVGNNGEQ